jgi:hypothetical protein
MPIGLPIRKSESKTRRVIKKEIKLERDGRKGRRNGKAKEKE